MRRFYATLERFWGKRPGVILGVVRDSLNLRSAFWHSGGLIEIWFLIYIHLVTLLSKKIPQNNKIEDTIRRNRPRLPAFSLYLFILMISSFSRMPKGWIEISIEYRSRTQGFQMLMFTCANLRALHKYRWRNENARFSKYLHRKQACNASANTTFNDWKYDHYIKIQFTKSYHDIFQIMRESLGPTFLYIYIASGHYLFDLPLLRPELPGSSYFFNIQFLRFSIWIISENHIDWKPLYLRSKKPDVQITLAIKVEKIESTRSAQSNEIYLLLHISTRFNWKNHDFICEVFHFSDHILNCHISGWKIILSNSIATKIFDCFL